MIIESVTNSSSKTIHIVNLSELGEVKVGRGSQCEVRITDVSVSRHHASFELITRKPDKRGGKPKKVLSLRDHGSKFGTLLFL